MSKSHIIKVSCTLLLLFCVITNSYAQFCRVECRVVDADDEALPGVIVKYSLDNKEYASATDSKGKTLFQIPRGKNVSLKLSHIGFVPVSKLVNTNTEKRTVKVVMKEANTKMSEVEVRSKAIILTHRGDTTVYKANSIKTNPDATALDMIRKLPGVSYKDGKLEAQGRIVGEIRVDGKEFYKNDVGMALKNLPKEIIDEVKVFEELSDYAQLAGFDDGSGTVIVDITTRKDNKQSIFGKGSAGYGTDDRYTLYGVLNTFGRRDRISLFAQWNNINEQNFSNVDLLGATGTISSNDPTLSPFSKNSISNSFSHSENNDISTMMTGMSDYGITKTTAAGANYSGNSVDGKHAYMGHYLYNLSDNHTVYNIYDEYFGETTSNNRQYQDLGNKNINHRLNAKYEYNITVRDFLRFRPSVTFQRRNQLSDLIDWTVKQSVDSLLLTQNTVTEQSVVNTSNELMYMHKFAENGHALSVDAKFSYTHTDEDMVIQLENVQSQKDVDQNTHTLNDQKSYAITASYIHPLNKHFRVKVDAGVNYEYGHIKQATETKVNEETEFTIDSLLCGRANTHHGGFLGNVSLMYNRRKWNLVLGSEYHIYEFETENDRETIHHSYNSLYPFLFLRYLNGPLRWNLQYRSSQKFPTVIQLQEAVNNSNAILSIKGNNRLEAANHHVLSSRLIYTNREAATHFVFFANLEFAENYIGARRSLSSSSFVEDGNHRNGEMYSYINTDGYWSAKGLLAYGFPIRIIKSNANLSTMLEYAKVPGYWDKDKLFNQEWDWNTYFTIGSNISENIDFVIDTNAKYCQRTNMTYQKKDISYWSLSYGAQFKWLITPNVPLVLECGRTDYFGEGVSQYDAVIANASIGYKFLKKRNAELQLICHDIFNQDNSFLQTTNELYRRNMTASLLKRHFLLKFTYNLNTAKK